MANTLNRLTYTINVEGIISLHPVWVRKVVIFPSSTADKAVFVFWNEGDSPVSTKNGETVTVTASSKTFASSGNFEQTDINPDTQIIKINYSATDENLYTMQIATNANNNTITVDALNSYHGTITDDSSEIYSWKVWDSHVAFTIKAPGTEKFSWELDFGDKGRWFPNLAMRTLSSSATLELFMRN